MRHLIWRLSMITLLGLALGACSRGDRAPLAPSDPGLAVGPTTGMLPDDEPRTLPKYSLGGGVGIRPVRNVPIVPGEVVVRLEAGFDFQTFNAYWGTSTLQETPDGFARLALGDPSANPWGWSVVLKPGGGQLQP